MSSCRTLRTVLTCLLFSFSRLHVCAAGIGSYQDHDVALDESKHEEEFFTFISRPDLTVPRWDINVLDESRVSAGYWFTAPYNVIKQTKPGATWNAPLIYDSNGELIWSGAPILEGWTSLDFRVLDVMGTPMLSLINWHEGNAWILDETYSIHKKIPMRNESTGEVNVHEFVTVATGTQALFLSRDPAYASRSESQAVGADGRCFVHQDGFQELDVQSGAWKTIFSWTSADHITLDESYEDEQPVNERCASAENEPWDFLHFNSIDKFPDGDFLLSGRRTFALYKVSQVDGSVVWRLGGKKSDFELDVQFSGQHSARVHHQNSTHTIISILDNASYKDFIEPTYENSRGMLLVLRTDMNHMRAESLMTFDHPEGSYAKSRGNMEILPSGNTWICWARKSLLSEFGADGSLLMTAKFRAGLSSYRAFKSPWVGRPLHPPDIHSIGIHHARGFGVLVHVSWNGATEVARWKLWNSDSDGRHLELLAESPRHGFETAIHSTTFACYVLVEAINAAGASLGNSQVTRTIVPDAQFGNATGSKLCDQDIHVSTTDQNSLWSQRPLLSYSAAVVGGIVLLIGILGLVCCAKSGSWTHFTVSSLRKQAYELIPTGGPDADASDKAQDLKDSSIDEG